MDPTLACNLSVSTQSVTMMQNTYAVLHPLLFDYQHGLLTTLPLGRSV